MANYENLKAAIDALIKANGQQEITGPILNAVLKAMVDSLGAGFELAGVATPSTNPGTPDQDVYWLAYQGGTYTNFGGAVLPTGISMLKWDGSWTSQTFFTVDDQLTPNSNNLAKSGVTFDAVMRSGAFDLTAYNGGVKYADLSAALTALNSLPAAYKRGGMSIKFVSSVDNKYVQYRLLSDSWNTSPYYWERYNDVITSNQQDSDFDISDEQFNVVMRLANGHIRTKNFDSSKDATEEERGLMPATDKAKLNTVEEGAEANDVATDNEEGTDLDFSDEQYNVVMRLANGHIRTKNFDSSVVLTKADIDTLYNTLRVINHPLHGKKVGFLGDSITYGYGLPSNIRETARYSSKFCALVGCTEVNLGVSGTCIASNTVNNRNDTRFVTRVTQANIGDLNFLFIFGGTNDFSYDSKPIGEHFSINQITPPSNLIGNTQLGPITDTDTFAGGLHDLILAIRSINPNLQMCFLTPLSRGRYLNGNSYTHGGVTYSGARPNTEDSNKNGNYLYEYEDAIIDITKFYAIPSIRTISLFNNRATDDGISDMFQADGDNIHLTVAGNERLAKLLFNWAMNNVVI